MHRRSTMQCRPRKKSSKSTGLLTDYLSAQLKALLTAEAAVRADLPDAVEQAGVAARRIRSVLHVYARSWDVAVDLDSRLGELIALLERARDAEVQRERLDRALRAVPAELVSDAVAIRLLEDLGPEALEATRALLEALNAPAYMQLVREVGALEKVGAKAKPRELAAALRRQRRRLHRAVTQRGVDEATYRRARNAAERLRDAADVLQPVYGGKALRLAEDAAGVEEILSELRDSAVMRERLRAPAVVSLPAHSDAALTFGLLYGIELERTQRSLRDLADIRRLAGKHGPG
jgi:CHAD domain-containing protein